MYSSRILNRKGLQARTPLIVRHLHLVTWIVLKLGVVVRFRFKDGCRIILGTLRRDLHLENYPHGSKVSIHSRMENSCPAKLDKPGLSCGFGFIQGIT